MKAKKKKNKSGFIAAAVWACVCMAVFYLASCSAGANRVEVKVEVEDPNAVDFEKYGTIVYKDLILESNLENYKPDKELKVFFLEELPKAIEKDIEPWHNEAQGERKTGTLLLSGTLKIDIKERSKIKEVEGESGKEFGEKKRAFVTVQHWNVDVTITLKNAADGTEIFKEDFKGKIADADPKSAKFNFEKIFFEIANDLVRKLTKNKKAQRRYLLL